MLNRQLKTGCRDTSYSATLICEINKIAIKQIETQT